MKIVIVDDSVSALAALSAAANAPDRTVLSFSDPTKALEYAQYHPFDLLLVDYEMPHLNGVALVVKVREMALHRDVPIVMITSETNPAILVEAIAAGATEFLRKPFNATELKIRLKNLLQLRDAQLILRAKAQDLESEVAHTIEAMKAREEELMWRLCRAMAYRNGDTGEHIDRVAQIAKLISEGLSLPEELRRLIYLATPLHDIGKIGVSDKILCKPGKLTWEETLAMREHVAIGLGILDGSQIELIQIAERIVAGHHEKWDGSGYPAGLVGDQIPLEARIVAVADVFDALCSERSYKVAWPLSEAYAEIVRCSGTHFDPACVAAFQARWDDIRKVVSAESDEPLEPLVHAAS